MSPSISCFGTSCHGVDDYDIHSAAPYQGFTDGKGLFAAVRLGNQKVLRIYAQMMSIHGVQGVFRIDEGCHTAQFLGFRNGMKSQGRFTG